MPTLPAAFRPAVLLASLLLAQTAAAQVDSFGPAPGPDLEAFDDAINETRDADPNRPPKSDPDFGALQTPGSQTAEQMIDRLGGDAPSLEQAGNAAAQAAGAASGRAPLIIDQVYVVLKNRSEISVSQAGVIKSDVPVSGTAVKKGDLLFKLDDDVPQAAVRRAEIVAGSDIDEQLARQYYSVAKNEYQQNLQINAKVSDTISDLEVERSYLTAERSRLDILKAQHEQEVAIAQEAEAKAVLKAYTVTAPFDGVIKQRIKQTGEAVRPGDPVVELIDLETVYVRADVPVQHLRRVQPGTVVQVIENYGTGYTPPGGPLVGRVVLIEPEGGTLLDTVKVKIEVDNSNQRLIPGLRARVVVP